VERGRSFQLTEEDLFRASRAVLHATRTCIKIIYNIKIIISFDKTHFVLRATALDKATYSCPGVLLTVIAKINLIGNCFLKNLNESIISSDGDIGHLSDISSSGVIMG